MSFRFPRITLTEAEVVDLVARMKRGDLAARNRLVESQYQRIMEAAGEVAAEYDRPGLREDLFSVGCLALIEGVDGFEFQGPPLPMFLGFALLVAKNGMRRHLEYEGYRETIDYQVPRMDDVEVDEDDPPCAIEFAPDEKHLDPLERIIVEEEAAAMLDALTERQRQVVDLLSQGYTQEEIAETLGVSQPTVSRDLEEIGWEIAKYVRF